MEEEIYIGKLGTYIKGADNDLKLSIQLFIRRRDSILMPSSSPCGYIAEQEREREPLPTPPARIYPAA